MAKHPSAQRAAAYHAKAEEVRIIAESMKDKTSARMLMTVSQDYLAMAKMLERAAEVGVTVPDLPDTKM